ncbi:MAG: hypothetical protein II919_08335 [Lachnospiraceae bacterium]|nr:hypothetical protein [Lachnospiraceae bacterium]
MPHINRIRVNNVKYNFGTQYYDDFMMRFSCKNTIYDLANGGGKSVLMLLLFQNLIPNCTLDDKQPIEKLFRTNEGSTTIHSLIEWRLSDVHVKDNFIYMLTGFCARKAKDNTSDEGNEQEQKNNQPIEYFNYCIFYRKFNDNDIKNLPLEKDGERITYTGLKNYLKELEKNDMSLKVKIFDRKGDYQRFIAEYGLYESEWEIIRGINKTEGHVRTYFETNYKTTRKVVEDLLIEEIIEKSFRNNYLEEGSQDKLAKTLLNIKDKLIELSRKKDEINNFDRQIEMINGFIERTDSIRQMFQGMEDTFFKLKKIHNSICENEKKISSEKDRMSEAKADAALLKKSLSGKVDTAMVIVDKLELGRLEEKWKEYEKEYELLLEEFENVNARMNKMEGGNYYLEYIEAKKEYDKLTIVMENMLKDNNELLARLKEAVAIQYLCNIEKKNEITKTVEKETESANAESKAIEELRNFLRKLDNEIAVENHEIEWLTGQFSEIESEMTKLKNETSLLLVTQAEAECTKRENDIAFLNEKIEEQEKNITDNERKMRQLQFESRELYTKHTEFENERKILKSRSEKILGVADKLEKLKEVYGQNDPKKLLSVIEKAYQSMVLRVGEEKTLIEKAKQRLSLLADNKPFGESENVQKLVEYIRRYHTKNVMSGAEYIKKFEEEDRLAIIRNNPMIVFSVIVFDHADQIIEDWEMMKQLQLEEFIPIINAEQLDGLNELILSHSIIDAGKVMCMIGNPDRFKDESIISEYEALKERIKADTVSYERKLENQTVVCEDYMLIRMIMAGMFENDEVNPKQALDELDEQIKEVENEIFRIKSEIDRREEENSDLLKSLEAYQNKKEEWKAEISILARITEYLKRYQQSEKRKKEKEEKLVQMKRDYSDGMKRLSALENRYQHRLNKIKADREELQQMERIWNEKYAMYFDDGIYQMLINEHRGKSAEEMKNAVMGKDDLDTSIEALLMGLVNENSSVTDKEKLINNYQMIMQKSLGRLDYLGLEKEAFDKMYVSHELDYTSGEEMRTMKKKADEVKAKQKSARKRMDECRSDRDRMQGKINHSISLIEKNYGCFDEKLVKSEEISTFIYENERLLSSIDEKLANTEKAMKKIEEEELVIAVLKKNSERLMTKSGIAKDFTAGFFENRDAKELEQIYNETAAGLDRFIEDRYKRSETFERELSMLVDTLKKLGAEELALELRMNITMPKSTKDVDELSEALKETNSLIELEKQRVEKGLLDIQVIKDHFENQCVQSCVNIKTELERLSRLSKITIDDENISILNLKIPYVSEELYKDRMSEYIDRIAKDADGFETQEERLKYIRNNLCWKKMFSVIVTDMNAIRLNLYKRERIAGQSRYLPYEEAVGSTGQSQGIYIQFLISIINYITSINSKNADAMGLRKVIFIDNPFGAAKDLYIWEPIFKLLKTNHVQLIVPARGATPAITGRFDVNYVLGQKMVGKKQQTVVVDYYSDVVTEELEYTTLSYEQTSLF